MLFSPGPGRAVPVFKVEEYSWEKEREQETVEGVQETGASGEIDGELSHGPVGR